MPEKNDSSAGGISKWKLAVGAASLFLFIVGVKRSFRTDEGLEIHQRETRKPGASRGDDLTDARMERPTSRSRPRPRRKHEPDQE